MMLAGVLSTCILLIALSPATAWRCRLPNHPYIERSHLTEGAGVHEFQWKDSGNYSQLVLDQARKSLIVGAKDYLFSLDANDLQLRKTVHWGSSKQRQQCDNSGLSKDLCQNRIGLLIPFDDKLLVCGSGFSKPVYNVTVLGNDTIAGTTDAPLDAPLDAFGICSGNPSHQSVGIVTRLGDVISATSGSSRFQGPMISLTPLSQDSDADPIRTDQYDIKLLQEPKFVAAFDVFPEVFVFFNEKAIDRKMEVTATLGRVCQTDNGGSDFVLEKGWTTFRKLRLSCSVPSKPDVRFTTLEHIIHDKEAGFFHGIFRTSSDSYPGSAVCSFDQRDIERAFNGDFLTKAEDSQSWTVHKNKMHFIGCKANESSLIQGFPEVSGKMVPEGKEPTNFLTFEALSDSFYYQLMATALPSNNAVDFHSITESFTRVELMTLPVGSTNKSEKIFFLATDSGALLKVYQAPGSDRTCLISETQLTSSNEQKIISLKISSDQLRLFVGLTDRVLVVPTSSCSSHVTESACLSAHDPTCGWGAADAMCLSWNEVESSASASFANWNRDLSKCPSYRAYWSKWSEWVVCKQHNVPGGLCECRHRGCVGCHPTDCVGPSTETRNCSSAAVVDVSDWRLNGVVHGAWTAWTAWTECGTGECGNEFVTRTRSCSDPAPRNGGVGCGGSGTECKLCVLIANAATCPPTWGAWDRWSVCTNTTRSLGASGLQSRKRSCSGSGRCRGEDTHTRQCFVGAVTWGAWGDCRCDVTGVATVGVSHRQPQCITDQQSFGDCPTHLIELRKCPCNDVNNVIPTPAPRADDDDQPPMSSMINIKYVVLTAVLTGLVCVILCIAIVYVLMKRKKGGHDIGGGGRRDKDITMDIQFAAKFVKVETVAESPSPGEQRYVTSKAIKANKKSNCSNKKNNAKSESLLNGNHGDIDIQRNSMV